MNSQCANTKGRCHGTKCARNQGKCCACEPPSTLKTQHSWTQTRVAEQFTWVLRKHTPHHLLLSSHAPSDSQLPSHRWRLVCQDRGHSWLDRVVGEIRIKLEHSNGRNVGLNVDIQWILNNKLRSSPYFHSIFRHICIRIP